MLHLILTIDSLLGQGCLVDLCLNSREKTLAKLCTVGIDRIDKVLPIIHFLGKSFNLLELPIKDHSRKMLTASRGPPGLENN